MKYQKGFKFMDAIRDYEVIEYMERFKMYRLNDLTDNTQDTLMTESEIDMWLSKKEDILAKRERNRIFEERQAQIEREEQEKELKAKQEYEFCHGYCDNKSAMQKGKILKTLNKKFMYNGKVMMRKQFVAEQIKAGKVLNNDKVYGCCFEWKQLNHNNRYDTLFIEITKTEYDYARYLIDNNIVVAEVRAV